MTKPLILLCAVSACFLLTNEAMGYRAAYSVGYGAFFVMACIIAVTFLWLWLRRATPLALGMAFGWAGAASVMGWWWIYNVMDRPTAMEENPLLFIFLSIYFVGAILHFQVIGRSFGITRQIAFYPVALAIAVSIGALALS